MHMLRGQQPLEATHCTISFQWYYGNSVKGKTIRIEINISEMDYKVVSAER